MICSRRAFYESTFEGGVSRDSCALYTRHFTLPLAGFFYLRLAKSKIISLSFISVSVHDTLCL